MSKQYSGLNNHKRAYKFIDIPSNTSITPITPITVNSPNGSLLFDGTKTLTINGNGVSLTNGNFTIEWWQKWNNTPLGNNPIPAVSDAPIISGISSGTPNNQFYLRQESGTQWKWKIYGIGTDNTENFVSSQSYNDNTWYYMVFTINNLFEYTMFQNGVKTTSGTLTYTNTNAPSDFTISTIKTLIGANFQGYISNFRITTGQCINPSLNTISIPTSPLTNITGTQLLLNTYCDSTYLSDNSPNSFTLTVSDLSSGTMTNSVISTPENPFSAVLRENYKSVLFPTNSFLLMNNGITFGSSTTPFTIETFFYCTYNPNGYNVAILGSSSNIGVGGTYNSNGLSIVNTSDTTWRFDSSGTAAQVFNFASPMVINTWYYIVVARDTFGYVQMWLGTKNSGVATSSIYSTSSSFTGNATTPTLLSGTSPTGANLTTLYNFSSPTYTIGCWANTSQYNNNTFINNLRVSNTCLYTIGAPSISIPTGNLTATASTKLLINNGAFIDQTGNQILTAYSGPSSSLLSPF